MAPPEGWVRRMLQWQPLGRGRVECLTMHWASKFEQFFFPPPAPFSRRRFPVDDCFIGQSSGNAISIPAPPDVHEWLGQIQAAAPYRRAGRRLLGGERALLTEAG